LTAIGLIIAVVIASHFYGCESATSPQEIAEIKYVHENLIKYDTLGFGVWKEEKVSGSGMTANYNHYILWKFYYKGNTFLASIKIVTYFYDDDVLILQDTTKDIRQSGATWINKNEPELITCKTGNLFTVTGQDLFNAGFSGTSIYSKKIVDWVAIGYYRPSVN